MKKQVFILLSILMLTSANAVAQGNVMNLNYSDFEDIDQTESRPMAILFGSNYCKHSKESLKLVKKVATKYGDQVLFCGVNCDTDENFEWIESLWKESGLSYEFGEMPGTPVWLFLQEKHSTPMHDKYYYRNMPGGWYPQHTLYHHEQRTLAGPLSESEIENFVKDILGLEWEAED